MKVYGVFPDNIAQRKHEVMKWWSGEVMKWWSDGSFTSERLELSFPPED